MSPLVTLWLPPRAPPTCIPSLYNLALRQLILHSLPILIFKPLIPRRPIQYLLSLPPHHRPLLLAVLLCLLPLLPPDSLRVLQRNAGDLKAWSTELLHFLSTHPVELFCNQESNLKFFELKLLQELVAIELNFKHGKVVIHISKID